MPMPAYVTAEATPALVCLLLDTSAKFSAVVRAFLCIFEGRKQHK